MRKNLFQTNSFRNKYQNLISQINSLEDNFKALSDSELKAKNFKLRREYKDTQNLEPLIVESFALTSKNFLPGSAGEGLRK